MLNEIEKRFGRPVAIAWFVIVLLGVVAWAIGQIAEAVLGLYSAAAFITASL